jgi:acyl-CoA dehydrogenase
MDGLSLNPIYYTSEHRAFADSVKRFVEKEISPYVNEWDEAGYFQEHSINRLQMSV